MSTVGNLAFDVSYVHWCTDASIVVYILLLVVFTVVGSVIVTVVNNSQSEQQQWEKTRENYIFDYTGKYNSFTPS